MSWLKIAETPVIAEQEYDEPVVAQQAFYTKEERMERLQQIRDDARYAQYITLVIQSEQRRRYGV